MDRGTPKVIKKGIFRFKEVYSMRVNDVQVNHCEKCKKQKKTSVQKQKK